MIAGFEVQAPEKCFISWDATHEEVAALPFVRLGGDGKSGYTQFFTVPVRIGAVRLEHLCFPPGRSDLAVQYYSMQCKNPRGHEKEYERLKQQLSMEWRLESDVPDSRRCYFSQEGLFLELSYWTEKGFIFSGNAWLNLSIENRREYPNLLLDEANEKKMHVSDCLILDEAFDWMISYKRDACVKRRPPLIASRFGDKTVFWRDDVNRVFGIAAGAFSVSFPLDSIDCVQLERLFPAKGSGGDFFCVKQLGEPDWRPVIRFASEALDKYPELGKVIGKTIYILLMGSDC